MTYASDFILSQLDRLRRQLRGWLLVDGLARVLLALVALAAADLFLDWSFQMDRPQRLVLLAAICALLAWLAYRRLWKPLAWSTTDDSLALSIEQQHPALHERLISALQFSRLNSLPAGASPQMTEAAISQGVSELQKLNLGDVLDRRRMMWNSIGLAAALLMISGTAVAGIVSDTIGIWFERNVLLTDREWPQDVHFKIVGAEENELAIPRGDDWLVEADVTDDSRRVPEEAWLEIRGQRRRERMDSVAAEAKRFQVQLANVTEPIEFRVVEARAYSDWIKVKLLDRPEVASLTLTATSPAYTGRPVETLPADGGPYQLLKGSSLSVRGKANKPLSRASITRGATSFEMPVTTEAFSFEVPAAEVNDGDYAISLWDTEQIHLPGRDNSEALGSRLPVTFRLKLVPDRPPQVQAKLVGVSSVVTANALIPIEGLLTDDFGVARAKLQRRHRLDNAESDVTGAVDLPELKLPAAAADFKYAFDLTPLQVPPGVSVSFFIEAEDQNNATGPGAGRSTVFLARVVTNEEFLANLLAREREQAQELERRIHLQDELLTDTKALDAATRGADDFDASQRDQFTRIRKRQKSIAEETAKISRKFEEMLAEIRNNRLETEPAPLSTRIRERIVTPLWKVSTDGMDDVLAAIDQTTRVLATPADRSRRLAEVAKSQQDAAAKMREILARMEQARGFQEAVNLLLEVQKGQEDVLKQTEKEKQDAIRKLLETSEKPKPQ